MRGASRASLSEARDWLVAAVHEPGTAAGLSDELFAFVTLLDAQRLAAPRADRPDPPGGRPDQAG